MTKSLKTAAALAFAALALFPPACPANTPGDDRIAVAVARWLEQAHYNREKIDDDMSLKLLETYLNQLDYNKLYLTREDVEGFRAKYGTELDNHILRGDLTPAREIFERYKQRVQDRVEKNKALAEKDYSFDSDKTVELNRKDSDWPADLEEADRLWSTRVEAELLQEHLSEVQLRTPKETVTRRYDQALRNVNEMGDEDVVDAFLTALAQSYDPHSEYLSPNDLENFQIQMKLSLVGIGAVLRSEDGYAKIMDVVPGGPADKDGRLAVGDRIVAVAQGDEEFQDVVDMKLDDVVEKIRGKKDTIVRLQIIPSNADDPSKRSIIEITRDKVKLKDQEAKAEILDVTNPDGAVHRIGWITLPSFYANMSGNGEPKSTTADVSLLLERLKKEKIEGLIIDLRRDGGGSLEEAINLTGLFIPEGPVVQARDPSGKIVVNEDNDPGVAYSGPLVVLMNRLSASASEIFAAALQDYGRAVIVGDERSFGKGTVQTVVDLDRSMIPFFGPKKGESGALKLTIQKFYRVRGGSTQLKGVESDIILPSNTDNPEIGEGSLDHRLDYDEVSPVVSSEIDPAFPLIIGHLGGRSALRVAEDPEFAYIREDMARLRERIDENRISINEDVRRAELEENKERKEARKSEREERGPAIVAEVRELTLDDARSNREELEVVAYERERDKKYIDPEVEAAMDPEELEEEKKPQPDPIRNETVRIMQDYIEISRTPRTARLGEDEVERP
jgi:carboxyl-terminal processing protease